jgi:hypothetical protein
MKSSVLAVLLEHETLNRKITVCSGLVTKLVAMVDNVLEALSSTVEYIRRT